jgi:hypothetical protein
MKINPSWFMEKMLDAHTDELVEMFECFDEDEFEEWYRGSLAFYEACQQHINNEGLEHLRDKLER